MLKTPVSLFLLCIWLAQMVNGYLPKQGNILQDNSLSLECSFYAADYNSNAPLSTVEFSRENEEKKEKKTSLLFFTSFDSHNRLNFHNYRIDKLSQIQRLLNNAPLFILNHIFRI